MNKIFVKSLFLFIPLLFAFTSLIAQTITVGSVDPGPYGSGSTIAVPFTINDASGCIQQNNIYSLYLCNALGNPIAGAPVDTIKNFYSTAFNFTVPAGTPAGTYTYIIKSSSPVVSSLPSTPFTILATAGGTAAATCPSTQIVDPKYHNIYGTCSGSNGTQYTFTNASSSGSTVTATFLNEFNQTIEASNVSLNPSYIFTANATNYVVTIKAVSASGVISTYAYQLLNNVVNSNLGSSGNSTACLAGGSAQLTYTIDITSANGIQHNYPGNLYSISWGDGSPNSVYTLCQIEALNGLVAHNYTKISCGFTAGSTSNAFPVNLFTNNLFCGKIGTVVSDAAEVYNIPQNSFTGPTVACTGTPVSFINTSIPGPCSANTTALYNWMIDGVIVGFNYSLSKNFVPTLTEGNHVISIHLVNPVNGNSCLPIDYSKTICVQDPPKPSFTIAQTIMCVSDGPVIPINTSVIDSSCNKQYSYKWTVKPSAGVTYNASAFQPAITFTSPGIYTVGLGITTASCGTITSLIIDTIIVNATPVAKLSADFSICGNNQTLSFDSVTTRPTYTNLTGTAKPQANTYLWTVTGGGYSYAPGYTSGSKYPHILFTDYTTYTITVTQQNNCGLVTSAPQHITFEQSPTVVAGNDTSICAGTNANLKGIITGIGVISYKWIGGGGTYTPSSDSLTAMYTPSAAEITAGHVTLSLQAKTSDSAPCNVITSSVIITITPVGTINSSLSKTICSNQRLNYQITSSSAGTTFLWTAKMVSGSAIGFTPSGTNSFITDSLINTDSTATTNAVIAYTIVPISINGCIGKPYTLNVTVTPLPLLTATAVNAVICSSQPANITLTTKLAGTKYTWTSTAPAGVSGNSNQTTLIGATAINNMLINKGTSPAKVVYTIIPYSTSGCEGAAVTTIVTVDPVPITAVAGPDTALCSANIYTLKGNSAVYGKGMWTVASGTGVTFSNDSIPNAIVSGLVPGNTYQFKWTISTGIGCQSQSTVTIIDNADVIASFKGAATNSCGSQTISFTNTSNNQSSASFLWNFGDGTTSTLVNPQHTFKETTNGIDTAYVVSLTVLSNCKQRPPVYDTITIISDNVIASILPLQTVGCAPFTLDVQNTSPGSNVSYKFYLYNGNTLVQEIDKTDKTDAVFTPVNVNSPTQYLVYMTALGLCGTSATTNSIPIMVSPPTVTPQMYIFNSVSSGCAPLSVFFVNNSSGGSIYHYNIYDANGNIIVQPTAGKNNFPYTFTDPGSYLVSITAANNCSPQGLESAKIAITVYPIPKPAFAVSPDCSATVSFLNTTTQNGTTPPGSLNYTWNFGDGSSPEYTFTPRPHSYDFKKSPFTVTLTAFNTVSGCTDSTQQTINVDAPLVAQFTEKPDSVVTIPNYEFSFIDASTGLPSSWTWDFGDGKTSTAQNPVHRYSDTGYYQVKLIISNNSTCTSSVNHTVRVTGTPGQLFLPNAFMPTGSAYELRLFMAKGSGIKTWELQIFNNYGQMLWETNKLDNKGSPVEGWDGTFRGVLMQQGAYIWQASATFINGSVWKGMSYNNSLLKRSGTVNLIR